MKIESLSPRQREIYDFILSPDYALVCHGAVRSGKTTHMAAAFLIWAMERFDRMNFAICGKTVASAERNILRPLLDNSALPYKLDYSVTARRLTVTCGTRRNDIYFFGGKDESSGALIQGVTLAGVLMDEAALMPESFVNQAMARCISVERAKFWFNCNPESPDHWFYRRWIAQSLPGVTRLHFRLEDNPALSPRAIEKTRTLYQGVFYDRYILGRWVKAEGLVYPMFDDGCLAPEEPRRCTRWVIAADYGIQNPTCFLLFGYVPGEPERADPCPAVRQNDGGPPGGGVWYLEDEYYHSGRDSGVQHTDQEYYEALCALAGDRTVECVIVDPSASSFITLIRRQGRFRVRKARNDVLPGIQRVAAALKQGSLKVGENCKNTRREFGLYSWDDRQDRPRKEFDHAMDALRYFVSTMGITRTRSAYRPLWN